ncbi:MAG: sulfur carrier protein ThiS [Proteobacteria bacterium]|nr:sulfur carrier protein ThiS [Pseudomonadota bacterium]
MNPTSIRLQINGEPRALAATPATLEGVVHALALGGKRIAIELNGEVVPRSRYPHTPVTDGDRLEIVGAVGGG